MPPGATTAANGDFPKGRWTVELQSVASRPMPEGQSRKVSSQQLPSPAAREAEHACQPRLASAGCYHGDRASLAKPLCSHHRPVGPLTKMVDDTQVIRRQNVN